MIWSSSYLGAENLFQKATLNAGSRKMRTNACHKRPIRCDCQVNQPMLINNDGEYTDQYKAIVPARLTTSAKTLLLPVGLPIAKTKSAKQSNGTTAHHLMVLNRRHTNPH